MKTFSDLASIYVNGESDHEQDRFFNFNGAVTAYAPLILDLNRDDGCTFDKFLTACQAVFSALKTDPEISAKLVESNRNLEWIKACKDQQGSVEQTSLKMVAKINQTGVFQISLPDERSDDDSKTPDNCVKMSYQKFSCQKAGESSSKSLSLEELKDLNSKLMLITAGTEGKKDVDRFSRILNLVEQVTRLFIDLVNAGCHLFSQWKMKVTTFYHVILFVN
jgi:ABC-type Fe3+-citrate transport system substrate-binding protein